MDIYLRLSHPTDVIDTAPWAVPLLPGRAPKSLRYLVKRDAGIYLRSQVGSTVSRVAVVDNSINLNRKTVHITFKLLTHRLHLGVCVRDAPPLPLIKQQETAGHKSAHGQYRASQRSYKRAVRRSRFSTGVQSAHRSWFFRPTVIYVRRQSGASDVLPQPARGRGARNAGGRSGEVEFAALHPVGEPSPVGDTERQVEGLWGLGVTHAHASRELRDPHSDPSVHPRYPGQVVHRLRSMDDAETMRSSGRFLAHRLPRSPCQAADTSGATPDPTAASSS